MKDSEIILCKGIKLDKNYENVLSYSESSMVSLCDSNKIYRGNKYSFIGNDTTINVEVPYKDVMYANYLAFKNPRFGNKWIFGWITDVRLLNPLTSEITWEIDVWSTWYGSFNVGKAFIEREHVADDTFGKHTIPEGLETGPFIQCKAPTKINDYSTGSWICIGVSELISEVDSVLNPADENKVYNDIFSGLFYCICTDADLATRLLRIYDKKGKANAVYTVFMIPKKLLSALSSFRAYTGTSEGITYGFYLMPPTTGATNLLTSTYATIARNTTLAGSYTPRNNKLFTGEFNYMEVTNNAGGASNIIKSNACFKSSIN